jgi:hypothetical protein
MEKKNPVKAPSCNPINKPTSAGLSELITEFKAHTIKGKLSPDVPMAVHLVFAGELTVMIANGTTTPGYCTCSQFPE